MIVYVDYIDNGSCFVAEVTFISRKLRLGATQSGFQNEVTLLLEKNTLSISQASLTKQSRSKLFLLCKIPFQIINSKFSFDENIRFAVTLNTVCFIRREPRRMIRVT
jgi:hypothetical protein